MNLRYVCFSSIMEMSILQCPRFLNAYILSKLPLLASINIRIPVQCKKSSRFSFLEKVFCFHFGVPLSYSARSHRSIGLPVERSVRAKFYTPYIHNQHHTASAVLYHAIPILKTILATWHLRKTCKYGNVVHASVNKQVGRICSTKFLKKCLCLTQTPEVRKLFMYLLQWFYKYTTYKRRGGDRCDVRIALNISSLNRFSQVLLRLYSTFDLNLWNLF